MTAPAAQATAKVAPASSSSSAAASDAATAKEAAAAAKGSPKAQMCVAALLASPLTDAHKRILIVSWIGPLAEVHKAAVFARRADIILSGVMHFCYILLVVVNAVGMALEKLDANTTSVFSIIVGALASICHSIRNWLPSISRGAPEMEMIAARLQRLGLRFLAQLKHGDENTQVVDDLIVDIDEALSGGGGGSKGRGGGASGGAKGASAPSSAPPHDAIAVSEM